VKQRKRSTWLAAPATEEIRQKGTTVADPRRPPRHIMENIPSTSGLDSGRIANAHSRNRPACLELGVDPVC